ncbi:MAG: hypothetical protein K2X93_08845 [Candidatus Obscuribacterales bacterium]|nr:hypothetical protein [Candidatus Obscuribacterales bacterium]
MYSKNLPYDEASLKSLDVSSTSTDFNPVDLLKASSATEKQDSVAQMLGTFNIIPAVLVSMEARSNCNPDALKKLLCDSRSSDPQAVSNLLELSDTNPELFSQWMDQWKKNPERVEQVAKAFGREEHLAPLLDLVSDKSKTKAVDALLSKPYLAEELLNMLGGSEPYEKSTADKIVQLLNGSEQSRTDAFRVLNHVSDSGRRRELVNILETPATTNGIDIAAGAREVLNLCAEATKSREQVNARKMLELISTPQNTDSSKQAVSTFLGLVTGDSNEKAIAEKIARYEDRSMQIEVLNRLGTPETKQSGMTLYSMGEAAGGLLVNLQYSSKEVFQKTLDRAATLNLDQSTAFAKALNTIRHPDGISRFLEIFNDPTRQEFCALLTKDLVDGTPAEFVSARRLLLTPSGASDNVDESQSKPIADRHDPVCVRTLEDMYADPKRNSLAKLILQHPDVKEQIRLTKTFGNPDNAALMTRVTDLLKQEPKFAIDLVAKLKTPEQMNEFLKIYLDKDLSTAATVLREQLRSNSGAEVLTTMLTSSDPKVAGQGKELLKTLNVTSDGRPLNPAHDGWSIGQFEPKERSDARMLVESGLSPKTIQILKEAIADEDSRPQAMRMLKLAAQCKRESRPQLDAVIQDLYSNEENRALWARHLSALHAENPAAATELLSLIKSEKPDLITVLKVTENPEQLKAIGELLQLRVSPRREAVEDQPPPAQPSVSATAVLSMLGNPGTASSAKQFIEMLSNKATHDQAIGLLEAASRGREEGTVKLLRTIFEPKTEDEKVLSSTVKKLVEGIDKPANVRALENTTQMLETSHMKKYVDTAVSLLQQPEKQQSVLTALGTLTTPDACAGMILLLNTPNKEGAVIAVQEMMKTASGSDLPRIESALEDFLKGEPGNWIFSLLDDPKTTEQAKAIILMSGSKTTLFQARRHWLDEQRRPKFEQLLAMAEKDPSLKADVGGAIGRVPAYFDLFHHMLTSKENQDVAKQINLLLSGDTQELSFGVQVLSLLNRSDPVKEDFVRGLIETFHSSETSHRAMILKLVNESADTVTQVFPRLSGDGKQPCRDFFHQLYESDKTLGKYEFEKLTKKLYELQASNPQKADAIWKKIDDPKNGQNPRRLLETWLKN